MCSNLGIGASLAAIFFALCIGLFLRRLVDIHHRHSTPWYMLQCTLEYYYI